MGNLWNRKNQQPRVTMSTLNFPEISTEKLGVLVEPQISANFKRWCMLIALRIHHLECFERLYFEVPFFT